jgi:hypothetical protein
LVCHNKIWRPAAGEHGEVLSAWHVRVVSRSSVAYIAWQQKSSMKVACDNQLCQEWGLDEAPSAWVCQRWSHRHYYAQVLSVQSPERTFQKYHWGIGGADQPSWGRFTDSATKPYLGKCAGIRDRCAGQGYCHSGSAG